MKNAFFRIYFNSDEGGGGGFDDDPISFGEAFGINPDGSKYEADPADADADPPDPTPSGGDGSDAEPGDATTPPAAPADGDAAPAGETPDQLVERLYAGKYKSVEELEKAHRELTARFDGRDPKADQQPPVEKPVPLFKGDVSEIKTQADLFSWAESDPEAAAMWTMENHERLSEAQVNSVMDNWIASQPWKAMQEIHAWQTQMMRDEFAERQAIQDMHYTKSMRDQGIEMAIKEQPLLQEHSQELGQFIKANPHLNQMVEGAQTAEEVKGALHAIFYMMAGPKLSQQALEAQVAARVKAEEKAKKDAEKQAAADAAAATATTIGRNTATPPGGDDSDEYTKAMQEKILNPSGRR